MSSTTTDVLRSRAQAAARTSLHCSAVSSRLPLYRELTKPGITLFVSCSAATGYAVTAGASFSPLRALLVWAATLLMSGGAAALNQVIELERDRMMLRTARRPLVSGQVSVHDATVFAWVLTGAGLLLSLSTLPVLTALFLALSHISYVNIYTPLKPRTPLCTLAGAFPGSLPVLAGAAAGAGGLNLAAWLLTGLLFAWQLPHFMAIGWLAREDYGRGGYAMLFLTDPSGRESAAVAVMYAAATGACALLLALAAPAGWLFVTMAALTGVVYSVLAGAFFLRRDRTSARRLFFSSLLVLPALLAALVFEVRVLG